jgi:hypothetical protein
LLPHVDETEDVLNDLQFLVACYTNWNSVASMAAPSPAALQVTVHSAVFSKAPQQPGFETFEKLCKDIGGSDGVVDLKHIENAYKIIQDIDIVSYLEKFCRMMWFPEDEALEYWKTLMNWGSWGTPSQRSSQILWHLQYHYFKTDMQVEEAHGPLRYLRKAFDEVSVCELFEERTNKVGDLTPSDEPETYSDFIKSINQAYGKELGTKGIVVEGWDWTPALNQGAVWKSWCTAFSSRQSSSDRGILLLLVAAGQPRNFPRPEYQWTLGGGDAIGNQAVWIAEYSKLYFPKFMKMAEALDKWVMQFYAKAYVNDTIRRQIEDELRAIVKDP